MQKDEVELWLETAQAVRPHLDVEYVEEKVKGTNCFENK